MLKIRSIEEKDNKIMKNLIQKILKDHGLDIPGTAYFDKSLDNLSKHYSETKASNYYILDLNSEIIGGAGYGPYELDEKITELQKIYIEPSYQGKGYASRIFEKIQDEAKKDGYKKMYIETTDKLSKANLVYLSWGFKPLDKPLKSGEHYAMNKFFIKEL